MTGKQTCEILKKIRRDIAEANHIPLNQPECTHKGDCKGTCPRCEAEVSALEKALKLRKTKGFKIALAGISAGLIAVNAASCDALDALTGNTLQGDMMMPETELTSTPGEIALPDGDLRLPETEETVLEGVLAIPETEEIVLEGDVPMEGIN